MHEEKKPRWKGKVHAKVNGTKPHQVWPILQDFFNLHKWFPTLATCYGMEGTNGQAGCIRYCAGFSIPSNSGDGTMTRSWSIEKLVSVDQEEMSLTYELLDSNIGFESYVATLKLLNGDEDGCVVAWSFEVDPIRGCNLEDLLVKYQKGLDRMVKRIEEGITMDCF